MQSTSGTHSKPLPARVRTAGRRYERGAGFFWMCAAAAAVAVAAAGIVVGVQPRTQFAQGFGDVAEMLAALVAMVACVFAARRGGPDRRGWTLLAVATGVWTTAAAIYAFDGLTTHLHRFPTVADIGFVFYSVPAAAALLCFPRRAAGLLIQLRVALDGLVIAASILFVNWSFVLGPLYHAGGTTLLARMTGLAYPIVDVAIASLVLALGMHRAHGARLPWLLLGGGLVALSVTDSVYVSQTLQGQTGLTGTVLLAGWVAAFLSIALATVAPVRAPVDSGQRQFTLTQELLPYIPVVAVLVELARKEITAEPFLLVNAAVLLVLVALRQVLMFERVALTGQLETLVQSRTAELLEERRVLAAVLDNLDTGVIACDSDGMITLFNPAARELYGVSVPPESVSQVVLHAADDVGTDMPVPSAESPFRRALLGAEVRNTELVIVASHGERRAIVANARPILDISGGSLGAVVAIHDITARKRDEVDLALARNAALDSSRLKSEFLMTMSHEIRTPMNGVTGLTDLLLDTSLDATQRQYAEGVRGAGDALLGVMNDILDFSKLEAGKVELESIDFDPRHLLDDVGDLFANTAQQNKKLKLVAYCQPDVPVRLRGDVGRIRQVLINLTSNALKFTAEGEVVIRARLAQESPDRVVIRFEVLDTGIGLAPSDQERIFEPFSQADASTTRRYGGTGLGLAICRRLTQVMGGEMELSSEVGKGSTFACTIPLERARVEDSSSTWPADALSGLRALIVDDNATNRTVLVGQLTGWGMRAGVAADGPMALRLMREAVIAGDPYRLAVLDMCIPDLDGLDLARLINADPALDGTELILMTSEMNVDAQAALDAGIGAVLTKLATRSELYDRIAKLTAPRQTGAPTKAFRPELPPRPAVHHGRVLVVEDNTINQLVAEAIVTRLGYQVDIVANGLLAVRAVAGTDYSAVLMDCHMPEMDGFEATAEIRRSDGDKRHTPIIAMTASARAEDRDRCLAAGMDDYISKPVDMRIVEVTLARWVPDSPVSAVSKLPGEGTPVGLPLL